jgi:hypothetical protein
MFYSPLLMTDNNAPPSPGSHLPRLEPRVWVISSGDSPIGISLAKQVLENGDFVVAGLAPSYFPRDEHERRLERFKEFLGEVDGNSEDQWKARLRPVFLDIRLVFFSFFSSGIRFYFALLKRILLILILQNDERMSISCCGGHQNIWQDRYSRLLYEPRQVICPLSQLQILIFSEQPSWEP